MFCAVKKNHKTLTLTKKEFLWKRFVLEGFDQEGPDMGSK